MLPTFIIFLREGIEASMIVSILLAFLDASGQRRYFKDIIIGVALALGLATGGGVALYFTIQSYDGSNVQTIFETFTYIFAVVLLTFMTFWMQAHAKTIAHDLRTKTERILSTGQRFEIAGLSFQAVGREGLETVIFTLAIMFTTTDKSSAFFGAVLGLAASLLIALLIYKFGRKINMRVLFGVVGGLLLIFAAALVSDTVENLQQLNWVPFLKEQLWNTTSFLNESSALGDIFHSFLGYAQTPTYGQAISQILFLVVAGSIFLKKGGFLNYKPKNDASRNSLQPSKVSEDLTHQV